MAVATQHRKDIDGLRGFAIALVVIFHVFVGTVSSGVDVFLFVGGIFFFMPQIRNVVSSTGLTFMQSLTRILRRLVPSLAVVLCVGMVLILAIYPTEQWAEIARQAQYSAFYGVNWLLAFSGMDYGAASTTISPFQHLWSMSAQMQIYVLSIIVFSIIGWGFKKESIVAQRTMMGFVVIATISSFIFACVLHNDNQSINYYATLSRFWEIGLGGIFGALMLNKTIPVWCARIAGVVGMVVIATTGIFLNGAEEFPGFLTLIPLSAAMLVVLSGQTEGEHGVTRLLNSSPFQFLGKISYSLYLWHWLLLITATVYFDVSGHDPVLGVGVICTSLVVSYLTYQYVEVPLRQKGKPVRARMWKPQYVVNSVRKSVPHAVGAVFIIALMVGVLASPQQVGKYYQHKADVIAQQVNDNKPLYPGAQALLDNIDVESAPIAPDLTTADTMMPVTQQDGCYSGFFGLKAPVDVVTHKNYNNSGDPCFYGDTQSEKTMYLVGGSHSEQFIGALDTIGKQRNIKIIPLLKMGCPVDSNVPKADGSDYPECLEWSGKVKQYIWDNPPTEGVVMSGTRPQSFLGEGGDVVPVEYFNFVKELTDHNIHTFSIRDNPWLSVNGQQHDGRQCLLDGGSAHDCGVPRSNVSPIDPSKQGYVGLNVSLIDLTPGICTQDWCDAVVGNVAVYRDSHHLTSMFVDTLTKEIDRQMFEDVTAPDAVYTSPPLIGVKENNDNFHAAANPAP